MKNLFLVTALVLTSTWVHAEPKKSLGYPEFYGEPVLKLGETYFPERTFNELKVETEEPKRSTRSTIFYTKNYSKSLRSTNLEALNEIVPIAIDSPEVTVAMLVVLNKGCPRGQDIFKSPVNTPQDVIDLQKGSKTKRVSTKNAFKIQVASKELSKNKTPCSSIFGKRDDTKKEFTGPTRQHYPGKISVVGSIQ